jgi:hypothetical protein
MVTDIDNPEIDDIPVTPDFLRYPMQPGLRSADIEAEGKVLRIVWADGHEARFHAIWLRDNASDAENLNQETRKCWRMSPRSRAISQSRPSRSIVSAPFA